MKNSEAYIYISREKNSYVAVMTAYLENQSESTENLLELLK